VGEQRPFRLEREVHINARRDVVFAFLCDSQRFAAWWGHGSTIDPRPGGAVHIAYPNGLTADGQVVAVEPGRHLAFTFGYDREDTPLPPGGSLVEIDLEAAPGGTLVRLTHHLPTAQSRDQHDPGWRYQLGLFAAAVSAQQCRPDLQRRLDDYVAAWNERDPQARRALLDGVASAAIEVTDVMARLRGRDELDAWIAQSQQQMAGLTLARDGVPATTADRALWDWTIAGPDGVAVIRGRNVARFDLEGMIAEVTGFWLETPPGLPSSVVPD
jgi:uncharacterized protein YndB with AHSA1/START domain